MHLQFAIYNLQIIFADLKKNDGGYICIYNLQFTNYFCQLKKSWVTHMQYTFTIYKVFLSTLKNHGWYICNMHLQFTNYFCRLKNKYWWYLGIYNLQLTKQKIIAVYTNAFSIIC